MRLSNTLLKPIIGACSLAFAFPATGEPSTVSALAPPVNHESGTIAQVLTAQDAGYRQIGYIVRWRDGEIFVASSAATPQGVGDNLDFTVYRMVTDGRRILRFAMNQSQSDPGTESDEADNSHASVTLGTAQVDNVLMVENEGYRFVAYQVIWHGMRVVVVDSTQRNVHQVGDSLDFRVLRSGAEDAHRLAFTLNN